MQILAAYLLSGDQKVRLPVTCDVQDGQTVVSWQNTSSHTQTLAVFYTFWGGGLQPSAKNAEFSLDQEGYLDTMDSEAVQLFIEYTHERYKAAVGSFFGTVIKGVFTDEVHSLTGTSPVEGALLLPWSRRFAEKFLERNGYDVLTILPELFIDAGEAKPGLEAGSADGSATVISAETAAAKARFDFWSTISEMYLDAYMAQIGAWCRANGLIFTGHGGGEESLRYHVMSFTDMFECFRHYGMPGIDSIYSNELINFHDFNFAVKCASSAARFHGKKRLLCETFSGSTHDMTLAQIKRIENRLFLLGVNYIQYMGAYYTLNDAFKENLGFCPTPFSFNNTLYPHFPHLNKYVSAMSWLVAETAICARALVLCPYAASRANAGGPLLHDGPEHADMTSRHPLVSLNLATQGAVNALVELNVPFEIASEQILDSAEVQNGRIRIGDSMYDVLVLPDANCVTGGTAHVYTQFARQGGRLVLIGRLPETCIDTAAPAATDVDKLLALPGVRTIEPAGYDIQTDSRKAKAGSFTAMMRASLSGIPPYIADVDYEDGIFSVIRKSADSYYLILANDAAEKRIARGRIFAPAVPQAIDTETGLIRPARFDRTGSETAFELTLAAFETAVLVFADQAAGSAVPILETSAQELPAAYLPGSLDPNGFDEIRPLNEGFTFQTCSPNWLIPEARLVADDTLASPANTFHYTQLEFHNWIVPARIKHPEQHVTAIYDFEIESCPETVELVTETEYPLAWFVNGRPAPGARGERIWDRENHVSDITALLVNGHNRLTAVGAYPKYNAKWLNQIPFAGLRGDFRVIGGRMTTRIIPVRPVSWTELGYARYSGDATYICTFGLDIVPGRVVLALETPDAAQVFINGQSAGCRLWEPYAFDLSPYVRQGCNQLEIQITSTLSNLFYHPVPSGLTSPPRLGISQKKEV